MPRTKWFLFRRWRGETRCWCLASPCLRSHDWVQRTPRAQLPAADVAAPTLESEAALAAEKPGLISSMA